MAKKKKTEKRRRSISECTLVWSKNIINCVTLIYQANQKINKLHISKSVENRGGEKKTEKTWKEKEECMKEKPLITLVEM